MALKGFKLSHILVTFFSFRVKELKPTLSTAFEEEDSPQIFFLHLAPV